MTNAIDRAIVFVVRSEPGPHPPQRALHARLGGFELLLDPIAERFVEQPYRRPFAQDLEGGIDPRLDGPLAEEVGAEAVDRAYVRFFELLHGASEPFGFDAARRGRDQAFLELFA